MRYGLTLLLLLGMAVAQQVELGAGSYVTRRPADIIDPPPTIFRSGWEGPAPTNRWWSSLLWTAFSETLYAGPSQPLRKIVGGGSIISAGRLVT